MEKPLLVLFDGNAIVHRAYHAFGPTKYRPGTPLTVSKTGEVVSAVYVFALMLLKALNDLKPTHIAIAFDKKGPTFRHDMFDDYMSDLASNLTPEERDILDEKYRAGLDNIADMKYENLNPDDDIYDQEGECDE